MGFDNTFGSLLAKHLQEADRSQAWLAKRLGTSASTVSRWLSNQSRPRDMGTVVRIADVLSVHQPAERQALLDAVAGYLYRGTMPDRELDQAVSMLQKAARKNEMLLWQEFGRVSQYREDVVKHLSQGELAFALLSSLQHGIDVFFGLA